MEETFSKIAAAPGDSGAFEGALYPASSLAATGHRTKVLNQIPARLAKGVDWP